MDRIDTLYIRLPCKPRGSWFTAITALFCRMALYSGRIVLRSTDINKGAANIVHMAIWDLDCS